MTNILFFETNKQQSVQWNVQLWFSIVPVAQFIQHYILILEIKADGVTDCM